MCICKWAASWQNQQNGMCAQRRLRSAWASDQSAQSLRCPHEKARVLSYLLSAQRRLIRLGGCPGWSESSLGAQSFCWFCHEVTQMVVTMKLVFPLCTKHLITMIKLESCNYTDILSHIMRKHALYNMRTAKAQISLHICSQISAFVVCYLGIISIYNC